MSSAHNPHYQESPNADLERVICLAIVGSTEFANDPEGSEVARRYIEEAIENLEPGIVISGGAVGIDQLGASVAKGYGIPVREYLPKYPRWQPDGYKQRNTWIAQDCTHLLCLCHANSKTYGSGWTADEAERLGKKVERYTLGASHNGSYGTESP